MTTGPVEKTIQYAAMVDTLTEAFALIMTHEDEFTAPIITIKPRWSHATNPDGGYRYEVSIGGETKQEAS